MEEEEHSGFSLSDVPRPSPPFSFLIWGGYSPFLSAYLASHIWCMHIIILQRHVASRKSVMMLTSENTDSGTRKKKQQQRENILVAFLVVQIFVVRRQVPAQKMLHVL